MEELGTEEEWMVKTVFSEGDVIGASKLVRAWLRRDPRLRIMGSGSEEVDYRIGAEISKLARMIAPGR